MSPRACLIARAARSRSNSDPSAITRSTASASCSPICATEISGTAGSPRRLAPSRRWALSMARSPPLTATYMSGLDPRRARQRGGAPVGDEDEVQAAREQRMQCRPARDEVARQRRRGERRLAVDAGAAQSPALIGAEVAHLHDQRRRAIGIFQRAERKCVEIGKAERARDEREGGFLRRRRRSARPYENARNRAPPRWTARGRARWAFRSRTG